MLKFRQDTSDDTNDITKHSPMSVIRTSTKRHQEKIGLLTYVVMFIRFILLLCYYLTIILRNRAEYRLILSRGRRPRRLKSAQTIFCEIEQDNCFIIQQIDNKTRNILKSFCRHFFTSLFLPTNEATYIAGYLLPTDDRYREHHDHIWIVLQFVE